MIILVGDWLLLNSDQKQMLLHGISNYQRHRTATKLYRDFYARK
ncbi:hypothetical protein [Bacillus sp. AFS017336]|nr:hypothetical protein [Bacillus sp. AFS017336]